MTPIQTRLLHAVAVAIKGIYEWEIETMRKRVPPPDFNMIPPSDDPYLVFLESQINDLNTALRDFEVAILPDLGSSIS